MQSNIADLAQRSQALNPHQSFIVQAPAGSGKTELLIQRMLTLLNHVQRPEEILAITFTKKAANEMRARVLKALKFAAYEPEPTSAHERTTWQLGKQVLAKDAALGWNLLTNPNQLRIQTIDALCAYLTKQLPLLSHFGSAPNIAPQALGLYRTAVQEVLTHVEEQYEWSDAIANLLLHLDNDLIKLEDLLIQLLTKRDQWLPYIHFDTNSARIRQHLEEQLRWVINDELNNVYRLFPITTSQNLMAIARYAADNLHAANVDSDIVTCRNYTQLPPADAAHLSAWRGIAKLLLTNDGEWRKRIDVSIGLPAASSFKNQAEKLLATEHKQALTDFIIKLNENDNLKISLAQIPLLPEATYTDAQWEILTSLLQVLKIAAAQLRVVFQQAGYIDFIENAQAALLALGNEDNPTDLALALDYQIKHILIDEFQDTSLTQYQLLEKLITGWETHDGRTLFVVGDPMQSIYRFREAEVGLFIRMWKSGIGQLHLTPLTLTTNFRSRHSIVEWNNQKFSAIFPRFNDIATGAVTYSNSAAIHMQTDATITIQGFAEAEDTTQANHITDLVLTTQQQHPDDSIAILVRSRSHLNTLIPVLKKANISYRAVDIDPLSSQQFILDLLSLTTALLHPADRIAWLSILRAPWCGLTLADLHAIANADPYATIYELVLDQKRLAELSENGRKRLWHFIPLIKSALADRERYALRAWLQNTWQSIGGPACLPSETDIDAVNAFFDLIEELANQEHTLNLSHLQDRIGQLYAPASKQDSKLQIMTIHTAKGLEFDTVILPHLERKNPVDEKPLLLWADRPLQQNRSALLLAPIHAFGDEQDRIYAFIRKQQQIKSHYETDRLLYVATTRAKKRLHLYFDINRTEKGHYKVEAGSFLEKLWPTIENQHLDMIQQLPSQTLVENTPKNRAIQRLDSTWQNPALPQKLAAFAQHQQQSGFQFKDATPRLVGIVIHSILQQLAIHGISWWQPHHAERYVTLLLKQQGVTPAALQESTLIVLKAISNILNDERGKWILHAHQNANAEFTLTSSVNNEIQHFIVDRTFVDTDGVRWIIDYKTTTFSTTDLDSFLAEEQKKYLNQLQQYAVALQLLDGRKIKMGLYFPAIPAWREFE